jgi:hypothetical protein
MKEGSRAKSADRDVFVPTSDTRVTITTGVKSAEQVRTGPSSPTAPLLEPGRGGRETGRVRPRDRVSGG